jgi:hypothetical protein
MHSANLSLFDALPPGFTYREDFITLAEERVVAEHISAMEFSEVRMRGVTARRRVRQFGWRYSFESNRVTEGAAILGHVQNSPETHQDGTRRRRGVGGGWAARPHLTRQEHVHPR